VDIYKPGDVALPIIGIDSGMAGRTESDALSATAPTGTRPASLRQLVLHSLDAIGLPCEIHVLVHIIKACHARSVQPTFIAALVRREKVAGLAAVDARSRPRVVPALYAPQLAPLTSVVANSVWPDAQRLVGAYTPRVLYLQVIQRLVRLQMAARARDDERLAGQLRLLVLRLAAPLPAGSYDASRTDASVLVRIAHAARIELDALAARDRAERDEAARRLVVLAAGDPRALLWGRSFHADTGVDVATRPATVAS